MSVQKRYRGNILTAYEPLIPIFLNNDLTGVAPSLQQNSAIQSLQDSAAQAGIT